MSDTTKTTANRRLVETLQRNWQAEIEGATTYRALAQCERHLDTSFIATSARAFCWFQRAADHVGADPFHQDHVRTPVEE